MSTAKLLTVAVALAALATLPATAADRIPETSGFGGFISAGPTYFEVASNLIVQAEPLTGSEVGDATIDSIFDSPPTNSSPGYFFSGEVNYTFAASRTQLFLGNRLEDLLRFDVVFGLGVRQELGGAGMLAASYLFTPAELSFWSDPYVEGEERQPTLLDFPGFRIRWGRIFGTGLELTVTDRFYRFGEETSGDWLIEQGRLDPEDQPLLDRDGDILRIQALYRIDRKRHRFEPALRWVEDDHKGAAIANSGWSAQLTYLYLSPKLVLDANLVYGTRKGEAANPIYGRTIDADRKSASLTAFIPVKRYTSSVLNLMLGGEVFREDTNIEFYDSNLKMAFVGLLWRHIKK